jgi:hypothetical protein
MHWEPTTVRKEPAADHRYGNDVSRRGGYVYAAYDGDKLIALGTTVKEARRNYRAVYDAERGRKRPVDGYVGPVRTRWNDRQFKE